MTKEEKIRGLYNLKEYLVKNPIELDRHKSLPITLIDYAIESLEQQPSEDCISRETALKAFAEKCAGECACCEYNGSGYSTAENCKLIKSLPSVIPKFTDTEIQKMQDLEQAEIEKAYELGKAETLQAKLDEIITKQIDISNNQVECQTLRWVLDVMSEIAESEETE